MFFPQLPARLVSLFLQNTFQMFKQKPPLTPRSRPRRCARLQPWASCRRRLRLREPSPAPFPAPAPMCFLPTWAFFSVLSAVTAWSLVRSPGSLTHFSRCGPCHTPKTHLCSSHVRFQTCTICARGSFLPPLSAFCEDASLSWPPAPSSHSVTPSRSPFSSRDRAKQGSCGQLLQRCPRPQGRTVPCVFFPTRTVQGRGAWMNEHPTATRRHTTREWQGPGERQVPWFPVHGPFLVPHVRGLL